MSLPLVLRRSALVALLALALPLAVAAQAQPARPAAPSSTPYPGEITLRVDATDLDRKILRVQQTLPVRPGPLTLYLPRWLPGQHASTGEITAMAGLQIRARGQALAWERDPLDPFAFSVVVPGDADTLDIVFQHLSPVTPASGRVVVTRQMLNLQWQAVLLYPAGWHAAAIRVAPTLVLPAGWQAGTALRPLRQQGGTLQFQPVTLEMLVDSPVFAGRHFRRIELEAPGAPRAVALNLVADSDEHLKPSEPQIEAHRELVRQADRLFASRHFAHYDFLLALSEELGGIGLEHHQSSENGVRPNYWEAWDKRIGARELLAHEYAHSWNGKFRRPEGLNTPDFQQPMQGRLLWLYEGQTEYWGWVLAARSGLTSPALALDRLARTAANYELQAGRSWRNLQDTVHDNLFAGRRANKDWRSWQRSGGDYYAEMLLVWLDADTLMREKSGGTKSLDDFAKAFFGVKDGELGPLPYRFDDIVAALNGVVPHDWAGFLRQRLDSHTPAAPLDGLARGGWRLVYTDKPTDSARADEAEGRYADFSHSLGLTLGSPRGGAAATAAPGGDARISSVAWGSPAFDAGLTPGLTLLAVNGRAYRAEGLRQAITANQAGQAPIELLLREGELFRTVRIDWRGGLRYPRLERVAGTEDRLTGVLGRR